MFAIVISPVHFCRGLFCCPNFNIFYIDYRVKNKFDSQKQSLEPLNIPKGI